MIHAVRTNAGAAAAQTGARGDGPRAIDAAFSVPFTHRLRIARGVFDAGDRTIADLLDPTDAHGARVLPVVDDGLARAQPDLLDRIEAWLDSHDDVIVRAGEPVLVPGGEAAKNDPAVIDDLLARTDAAGLCRRSYVLAVGGGAVLDAAGLAASLLHRGVRTVRVPTTTLSQADSGVGVKNGVNLGGKKNLAGTFAVPWAVVNDAGLLASLPDRHWRAGFAEALKVALLKDPVLFDAIERGAGAVRARDLGVCEPIVTRSAELHLRHIAEGGDPFELGSARPLDFGHWSAHRLESMSGHEITHGDAVAIGLAIDCVYARGQGLLGAGDTARVLRALRALGFGLSHPLLSRAGEILEGVEQFREHIGGPLVLTMIGGIGEPIELTEIDRGAMAAAIGEVYETGGGTA